MSTADSSSRTADLWSGVVLAAMGAAIAAQAWQWEYMGPDGPGPGFFPLWCGIAMVALSGYLAVASALRVREPAPARTAWGGIGRALATWAALVASVSLFKLLGFMISFALFTFFIVAVMYRRSVALAAAVAVASAAAFYLLFPLALGIAVPAGALGL